MRTTSVVLGTAGIVGLVLASVAQADEMAKGQGGRVYLHETFESYDVGAVPDASTLERSEQVTTADGGGKVGSGKVADFNDSNDTIGAMEYCLGNTPLETMYIEFDALNNAPSKVDEKSNVIFGVGEWTPGRPLGLSSKAKRAFGLEMYQKKFLKVRAGDALVGSMEYDSAAPFNVKIWANDNDENTLSYKRPDNGEAATLDADSFVLWVNNALFGEMKPNGHAMNGAITKGNNKVIGRAGFNSSSTKMGNFLIDNLHFEDVSVKMASAAGSASKAGSAKKGSGTK